jgi:DNA polymerase I-like protein with 3'-5' exonuclease and polymerase domains
LDELLMEVEEPVAEVIGKLGVKTIEQAGKLLKFNLPLTGDYKVGDSWADVH